MSKNNNSSKKTRKYPSNMENVVNLNEKRLFDNFLKNVRIQQLTLLKYLIQNRCLENYIILYLVFYL